MIVLFNPSFDSGYFIDYENVEHRLGTKVVGLAGLLDHLSLHNGLSGRFASDGERAASYFLEVTKCVKGTWIEGPFKNDGLGVSKCLLEWRDLLIMAGWTPGLCGTEQTKKLQLLSRIESFWGARMKGSADRWLDLAKLAENGQLLNVGDRIKCTCSKEQLPMLVQRVLEAYQAEFEVYPDEIRIPDSLNVRVLHYNNLSDAYRQVASRKYKKTIEDEDPRSIIDIDKDTVIINRDSVSLNHILLSWGEPLQDATIQRSNPLTLQLFKLAVSVFSRPLNIQNLLSYLQLPVGPVPGKLRSALANVLVSDGGFGVVDWDDLDAERVRELKDAGVSSKWDKVIRDYIDTEEENNGTTRVQRESKASFLRYITDKSFSAGKTIPVQMIKDYVGSIDKWAASIINSQEEKDVTLKSQLSLVISYFKQLLETLGDSDSISYADLEKHVNTIYQPTSIIQSRAQVGSLNVVSCYQQLVDTPKSIVWLDCCGADPVPDRYDFLSALERIWLVQNGVRIPLLQDILELNRKEMITTLSRIPGEITLVTADYHHNQKMAEHPFLAELKMQRGKDLMILNGSTRLPLSAAEDILKIEQKLEYNLGSIKYDGRSESNTSIDTLINYPFDYTVHYVARLGEPSKKELGSISKVDGLVAHLFIQNLVNDVLDRSESERISVISDMLATEFDERFDNAIQSTGLALLLKENEVEYGTLRFLLERSLKTLVKIMEYKRLVPIGCELKYDRPVFSDKSDFNARIDMELINDRGETVIFDFKWSYSAFYGNKIKEGKAVQLELYRKELEQHGKCVKAVGFYLLPKCVLETSDFETYKDSESNRIIIHHIDPSGNTDLFSRIQNSVSQRKKEIQSGNIEEGEEMDILPLTYSQRMLEDDDMLWVGTKKTDRSTVRNPDPPVKEVIKESPRVFVNKPESRFHRMFPEFESNVQPNEKPTTYPLLKGRLK